MQRQLVTTTSFIAVLAGVLLAAAPAFADGNTLTGTVKRDKGSANLIVYVEKADGTFSAPSKDPVMDQKGMKFSPHILPVLLGTTVDFVNNDSVNHNVFSPDNEGYNLGTWKKGDKRTYTFKHLGVYTQLCSIHPDMEAFILVLQNSYYAMTDASGNFSITGLPAGKYTLKVWGEKLKSKEKKKTFAVDVADGGSTTTLSF